MQTAAKGAQSSASPTDTDEKKRNGVVDPAGDPSSQQAPPATPTERDPLDLFRERLVDEDEQVVEDEENANANGEQPETTPPESGGEAGDDEGGEAAEEVTTETDDDGDDDEQPETPAPAGDGEGGGSEEQEDDEEIEDRIPDAEFQKLSPGVRKRIGKLSKWKKENREFVKVGQFVEGFVEQNKIAPEEFNFLLGMAAAIKRSDPKAIDALEQMADNLRTQAGVAKPAPQAPQTLAVAPFQGDLPDEYKDLVDVYGMEERKVRIWLAAEKLAEKQASKAPETPPAPAAPQPPAPTPAPVAGAPDPQERMADMAIITFLTGDNVPKDKVVDYVQKELWPIMAEMAPEGDPTKIPLSMREQAARIAHERVKLQKRASTPPAPAKPTPSSVSSVRGPRPGKTSSRKPDDPLDQWRRRIAAE